MTPVEGTGAALVAVLLDAVHPATMLSCPTRLPIDRDALAGFCRRHHIRKLSLFGSVLRDDFRADSDVDVLVEFEEGHVPGFIALHDLEEELSRLLGGRRVAG